MFQSLALFLLAVWLPATLHCALESAGVIASHCDSADAAEDHGCVNDACPTIESALFVTSHAGVTLVAPAVHADDCLRCLALLASRAGVSAQPVSVPLASDWVVSWNFVHRTAPPARAPTALLA